MGGRKEDRRTDKQTDRQTTDRQTDDRRTDRRTDRPTDEQVLSVCLVRERACPNPGVIRGRGSAQQGSLYPAPTCDLKPIQANTLINTLELQLCLNSNDVVVARLP